MSRGIDVVVTVVVDVELIPQRRSKDQPQYECQDTINAQHCTITIYHDGFVGFADGFGSVMVFNVVANDDFILSNFSWYFSSIRRSELIWVREDVTFNSTDSSIWTNLE